MKNVILSDSRGGADHGWLKTRFSFSFAEYYDPERMGFGALRVINDDQIAGASGFGTHAHQNMEIITIMMKGVLTHKDSMGTEATISVGEVQVMSAGTGVLHSEYNAGFETVELFQIWIEPKVRNIESRYDQKKFEHLILVQNKLSLLFSPDGRDDSLTINQDALLYTGTFDKEETLTYTIEEGRGVYLFVVRGEVEALGERLQSRDALEVSGEESIRINIQADTHFLLFEVPMTVKYL
jgi:quercetin 2,3-dioxygenase